MIAGKRIALVIQGPLRSSGMDGSGAFCREFDCAQGIRKLIADSDSLIDGFVLSTWRGGDFSASHPRLRVIHLLDPGPKKTFFSRVPSSEFRQAYGCHEGVEVAIKEFSPDYVLKVRTDQIVDVVALVAHMINTDATQQSEGRPGSKGLLFFPNMLSWSPYSVGDFYIGGRSIVVRDFFRAQLDYADHSVTNAWSWVHSDIVLRHAYRNLRGKLAIPDFCYFPNILPAFRVDLYGVPPGLKYEPSVLRLWAEMLRTEVSLFPRSALMNMVWRGKVIEAAKHDLGECYDEWLAARSDALAWLVSKQPKLYAHSHPGRPDGSSSRFVNFNLEKGMELARLRPPASRYIFRTARILVTLLCGQWPREKFPFKLWIVVWRWRWRWRWRRRS